MNWIVVVFLMVTTIVYFIKYKILAKDLENITSKIKVSEQRPNESICLMSSEKSIQELITVIDSFIDRHRELDRKVEQLNKEMKNMLTNISHDLRTPLTVISGYVEVMKQEVGTIDPKELLANLSKIERQSQKLITNINNYFDFSKLNSGEMEVAKEPIDVSELLTTELFSYYEEIEKMDLRLEVDIFRSPSVILGDSDVLRRIFTNLLSNSLKYGQDGHYLAVKNWQTDNFAYIEITDKGKGIAEENQELIFERLTTLEDATDKNYSSNGLGLAITKRLVQQLNGQIRLYSKPFVRTTFTIEFPLHK